MCTNIADRITIAGSGRGEQGWFRLAEAWVSYDHPFHAQVEHALNLDFVDGSADTGSRVAVELTLESARALANAILAMVSKGEAWEAV